MAIIEVHEIPKPIVPDPKSIVSHREEIQLDIQAAFESKVAKFEFVGDYNYKYLARQATEIAEKYYKNVIIPPIRKKIVAKLRKELKIQEDVDLYVPSGYELSHHLIKIHGVTLLDRKHVYGEIDFKYLPILKKKLLEEARKSSYNQHENIKKRSKKNRV